MELLSNASIPDGLPASMTLLSEKPRLGVRGRESALHPGIDERNCTALLGLRFRCSEIVSGTVVAPNNVTPNPPMVKTVQNFVCKGSPTSRILASVTQGAIVGAIRGGASGFIGGELFEPIGGGIPGAILGGFLGGTIGAAGGVFTGSAIAIGCSTLGAYGGG